MWLVLLLTIAYFVIFYLLIAKAIDSTEMARHIKEIRDFLINQQQHRSPSESPFGATADETLPEEECPGCGETVSLSDIFCPSCGLRLAEDEEGKFLQMP